MKSRRAVRAQPASRGSDSSATVQLFTSTASDAYTAGEILSLDARCEPGIAPNLEKCTWFLKENDS
jgi:hypothetical protein